MRRTKQVTSLFVPEVYKVMEEAEDNISWYLYELACADLLRRGKLTMQQWMDAQKSRDEVQATSVETDTASTAV